MSDEPTSTTLVTKPGFEAPKTLRELSARIQRNLGIGLLIVGFVLIGIAVGWNKIGRSGLYLSGFVFGPTTYDEGTTVLPTGAEVKDLGWVEYDADLEIPLGEYVETVVTHRKGSDGAFREQVKRASASKDVGGIVLEDGTILLVIHSSDLGENSVGWVRKDEAFEKLIQKEWPELYTDSTLPYVLDLRVSNDDFFHLVQIQNGVVKGLGTIPRFLLALVPFLLGCIGVISIGMGYSSFRRSKKNPLGIFDSAAKQYNLSVDALDGAISGHLPNVVYADTTHDLYIFGEWVVRIHSDGGFACKREDLHSVTITPVAFKDKVLFTLAMSGKGSESMKIEKLSLEKAQEMVDKLGEIGIHVYIRELSESPIRSAA